MPLSRGLALASLASMTLAAGCFDVDRVLLARESAGESEGDGDDSTSVTTGSGLTSPISTVTGVTSSGSDPATGGAATRESPGTGDGVDQAPTIDLELNHSATPAPITQAGTQTITAVVADDHGLDHLEIFLDDAAEPLATIPLAGALHREVEVDLPIHESLDNGLHTLRGVVHDGADQIAESPALTVDVHLPEGGSKAWEVVAESKFVSKALAVAVDSIGDVIAVGEQAVSIDPHRSRMMIRKYRGEDGALLWQREVPSQSEAPVPAGNHRARGVAVDSADNVIVVGEIDPDGDSKPSLWLGKFTLDGLLAGTYASDVPRSQGKGVVVDEDDQIFVVGYRTDVELHDTATIDAFSSGLSLRWSDAIADIGALGTQAYGVAIDRHGDLVVVGSLQSSQNNKASLGLIATYGPSGVRNWWHVATTPESEPRERLFSVLVDADNEYVCVGRLRVGDDKRRLWLLRMADDGQELLSEPDLFARCGDQDFDNDLDLCGVARGPEERIYMAGVLPQESDDFLVKKTKSDWTINLWATARDGFDHDVDRGLAVATDEDGYVVAAGYQTRLGVSRWWVTRQNP